MIKKERIKIKKEREREREREREKTSSRWTDLRVRYRNDSGPNDREEACACISGYGESREMTLSCLDHTVHEYNEESMPEIMLPRELRFESGVMSWQHQLTNYIYPVSRLRRLLVSIKS